MPSCRVAIVALILCCVLVQFAHSLEYGDVEAIGIACPQQHKCLGSESNLDVSRDCKCDSSCVFYQDCCIDVGRQPAGQTPPPIDMMCLNYGDNVYSGVFAMSRCSNTWKGPTKVKQNCEGSTDDRDPVNVVPVTSLPENLTYKNPYCAACNNADMSSLKAFQLKISCEDDTKDLSEELIKDQLIFNQEEKKWGIYRLDGEGNADFRECRIRFAIPAGLRRSVRYCRANIISECARDWPRPQDQKLCEEYTAVVYDRHRAYRNPHCAICNNKTIPELSCKTSKKRPISFNLLLDVNLSNITDINRDDSTIPSCPSSHRYDPFFKKCRRLQCPLPRHVVKNGKCVRDT